MKRILAVVFAGCLTAGMLAAGEKKLMHCFVFTAIDSATSADWNAFYKATDELPGKIPGLTHVWYGKLRSPQTQLFTDRDTSQKLAAAPSGGPVTGPVTRRVRQYGACMEFNDEAAVKAYVDNPAHKQWVAAYEKVRQPGTATFDLLGQ